jgi:hypothetical protein
MDAIYDFIAAHPVPLLGFMSLVTLVNHLRRKSQVTASEVFAHSAAMGIVLAVLVSVAISDKRLIVTFGEFTAILIAHGVWLFVLLCVVLKRVGAYLLTHWRGEKWVKELDYI